MRKLHRPAAAALLSAAFCSPLIAAPVIDVTFQEGSHGEVITNKFLAQYGFVVSANNLVANHPDKAIIFNSRNRNTADTDLEGFNTAEPNGKQWTRGNLAGKNDLGKILIIAENDVDANNNGLIDSPDDEGARPAGSIFFDFRTPITQLQFNLVDIEGPVEYGTNAGYVAVFTGPSLSEAGGVGTGQVGFAQFITNNNPFYDSTIRFGDNSANQFKPITAAQMNLASITRVEFNLGGSGAVDRLRFIQVPEPTAMAFAALAPLALRRKRR